jgi:hypothetical protein
LSLLLACHLFALILGNVPDPTSVRKPQPRSNPPNVVTRLFDRVAAALAPIHVSLWSHTRSAGRLARAYLSMTGLGQSWNMFSNPPRSDEYLRVRYYVGSGTTDVPRWMATELIMPTGREGEPRLLRAFWDSYRDKAFANALERFERDRPLSLIAPNTPWRSLPDALAPITRYFGRRFAARSLHPDERLVRIEAWYGRALNPEPGVPADAAARGERMAVLLAYYDGPVENRFKLPPYPPYYAVEEEADIHWLLEYFEQP